jgi:hypothetical protein
MRVFLCEFIKYLVFDDKETDVAHNELSSIFWPSVLELSMSRFVPSSSNRRVFMMQVATAATAVMVVSEAAAQAMVDEKDPQAAEKAILVGESLPKKIAAPAESAAWTLIANLVLNLDETVSRN